VRSKQLALTYLKRKSFRKRFATNTVKGGKGEGDSKHHQVGKELFDILYGSKKVKGTKWGKGDLDRF